MKFAIKPLLAAVALAAGSTHAAQVGELINGGPLTFVGGSGTLTFSPGSGYDGQDPSTVGGLIGALNVGRVQISPLPPVMQPQVDKIVDEFGEEIRVGTSITAPISTIDVSATGQVLSVQSTGGALQTGTRISGTLNGGTAAVTNLRFDLVNQVVYADLTGRSAAVGTSRPAVDYVLPNTALWTFETITGPTALPQLNVPGTDIRAAMEAAGFTMDPGGTSFSAVNVISGLKVTQAGYDFFANSLGLLSTGRDALSAVNSDPMGWGSVSSKITVSVVPEPSTYAMAFVGLVAVAAATRRRGPVNTQPA